MDKEFRRAALNRLVKIATDQKPSWYDTTDWSKVDVSQAGILGEKIVNQFKPDKFKYSSAGINLSVAGTQVIWPGPEAIHSDGSVNILFFFRGGSAGLMAKTSTNAVVVLAEAGGLGGGPSRERYGNASFVNSAVGSIIAQLKQKTGRSDIHLGHLGLCGWSGGYDPIHGIVEQSNNLIKQPDYVGLFDGMHHGSKGKPNPTAMQVWQNLAEKAAQGDTQFVVTHSAVDPGAYASTTDTSNWLVQKNDMQRVPVKTWNGIGKKPDTIATKGNFAIVQLYANPENAMGKIVPGMGAENQHVQAIRSAPDYIPHWN